MNNFHIKPAKTNLNRSLLAAAALGVLKCDNTMDHLLKTDIARLQAIVTKYSNPKVKALDVSKHAIRLDKTYTIAVRNIGDLIITENEIRLDIKPEVLSASLFSELALIEPKLIAGQKFFVSRFSFSRRTSPNLRLFMAIAECSGVEISDTKSELFNSNICYDDNITESNIALTYTCRTHNANYMRTMRMSVTIPAETLKETYNISVEV